MEDEVVKKFLISSPVNLNSGFHTQPRKGFCTPQEMPFTETVMGMECSGVVEPAVGISA